MPSRLHSFTLLIISGCCAILVDSFISLCYRHRWHWLRPEPPPCVAVRDCRRIGVDDFKLNVIETQAEAWTWLQTVCTYLCICVWCISYDKNVKASWQWLAMAGHCQPLPLLAIAVAMCITLRLDPLSAYVLHTEKFHDIDTVCFVESHVCT